MTRLEISEAELQAALKVFEERPAALTIQGVPLDRIVKYLSFALSVIQLWKEKFGTKKPWVGKLGKILSFIQFIWKFFKII
jgi:hypothetical protein